MTSLTAHSFPWVVMLTAVHWLLGSTPFLPGCTEANASQALMAPPPQGLLRFSSIPPQGKSPLFTSQLLCVCESAEGQGGFKVVLSVLDRKGQGGSQAISSPGPSAPQDHSTLGNSGSSGEGSRAGSRGATSGLTVSQRPAERGALPVGWRRRTCISFRSAFAVTVAQGTTTREARPCPLSLSKCFGPAFPSCQHLLQAASYYLRYKAVPTCPNFPHLSDTGLFHINTRARKGLFIPVVLNSRESIVVASKPQ